MEGINDLKVKNRKKVADIKIFSSHHQRVGKLKLDSVLTLGPSKKNIEIQIVRKKKLITL